MPDDIQMQHKVATQYDRSASDCYVLVPGVSSEVSEMLKFKRGEFLLNCRCKPKKKFSPNKRIIFGGMHSFTRIKRKTTIRSRIRICRILSVQK